MRTDQTITHWDKAKIESVNLNENYDALEKKLSAAKMFRKHIAKVCFNHHYLQEAKNLDKMENNVEIEWLEIFLSYINNLIEGAIKIIEYGHSDYDFEILCIKFAAYVFLAEYEQDSNEMVKITREFGKPFWILKFLQKVNKIRRAQHRIEALLTSVCSLLRMLCYSRTNRQRIMFMQFFQGFVQENEIPDVGTFIEAFAKDFEALYKLLSFTMQKPMVPDEMKQAIDKAREERLQEKEEDLKRQEISELSEEEEEEKKEDEEEQGVKRIEVVEKEEEEVDSFESIPYNKNILLTLCKDTIPLNLHLLTMVFSQKKMKRIRDMGIDILMANFAQRDLFLSEIVKIELIITEQEQEAYNQYKDNYNRVKKLTYHLILDDLEYLLMQNFDKEKYKNRVRDTTIIMKNIRASLKRVYNDKNRKEKADADGNFSHQARHVNGLSLSEYRTIKKNQNILRQYGMHKLIIECMKKIYYRASYHYELFSAFLKFLEYFCWQNRANQEILVPHIGFFLSLTQWDLDSPALISEIMKGHYDKTDLGQRFLKYIVEKVTKRALMSAHLFNFLALMASKKEKGNFTKLYIVNRMLKTPKLRELMMDKEQADKKIEILEVYHKKRKTLKDNIIMMEKDTLDSHLSLVHLYAHCATKNVAAIFQLRRIVEVDQIYNNIFSEAIPFIFKKVYYRFFFELYIRVMENLMPFNLNDDKFVSFLVYVVHEDLKMYSDYLPGLLLKVPEEEEASVFNEAAQKRLNLKHHLEDQAEELENQFDRDKQQREIDKFRDYKQNLSPLTSAKAIPLFTDDPNEYWLHLSSKFANEEEDDGLLQFIIDLVESIKSNTSLLISNELIDIISKIRQVLGRMSDTLHLLYTDNPDELSNVPALIKAVDYTLHMIPQEREFKRRQKFAEALKNDEDVKNEDHDEEEEAKGEMTEQNTDVQKVLQILRDHIISGSMTIRKAFGLPDGLHDHYLEFYEFKALLKEIAGRKVTYFQIENCTEFLYRGAIKLEEDKKKEQKKNKILDKSYYEKPHEEVINFKYFEQIIRKILKKAGYKPSLKKRERDEEQTVEYKMPIEDLGVSLTNDFNNFIRLYIQYQDLIDQDSELELVFMPYFSKMLRRLKENVSKGAIQNETDKAIVAFFKNLIHYIGDSGNYKYLLKIFIFIINSFDPNNHLNVRLYMVGSQMLDTVLEREDTDIFILKKIQTLLSQAGIIKYILDLISFTKDDTLLDTCIELLIALMSYSNFRIQKEILKNFKSGTTYVKLFGYLKNRLAGTYIKTHASSRENPIYNSSLELAVLEEKAHKDCFRILDLLQSFCSN